MKFELMSDEQVLAELGRLFEGLRQYKQLQDTEIQSQGGVSRDAISKLRNNRGSITLTSLVKIMRGLGELGRLEALFKVPDEYRPSKDIEGSDKNTVKGKRIHKIKAPRGTKIQWGDE